MRVLFAATSAIAILATSALADPVSDRIGIMKSNGQQMSVLAPIARGQADYDAAVVMAALQKLSENAVAFDPATLFPEGTDTGNTTAAPAIWEKPEDFLAAVEKFKADTAKAVEANPQDIDAFRAVFGDVAGNCGACHETFRVRRG